MNTSGDITVAPISLDNRLLSLELALELLTNGARMPSLQLEDYGIKARSIEPLKEIIQSTENWNLNGNLIGMGIGDRCGIETKQSELCLKVYVREKLPKSYLSSEETVPQTLDLPEVGLIPMDVEAIGPISLDILQHRVRPASGGYCIGHTSVSGGTLGCLVYDRKNNENVYILSNSHVIANSGVCSIGDPIIQPCASHGGTSDSDVIASLVKWVDLDYSDYLLIGWMRL